MSEPRPPRPAWFESTLERVRTHEASVAVVGCGYVGLTLAGGAARAGFRVTGIETDERRAKELQAGNNPVPDVMVSADELASLGADGRLLFATALEKPFDTYVICVNTPLRDGSPDLSFIRDAGESVARVLRRGALVVLESTTYPGTTEELLGPLLTDASGLEPGPDFGLAHSPERINPGDHDFTLRNTPKVVGGVDRHSTELAAAFYAHLSDRVVPVSSPRTAEITKLLENSYRHVNIALANEMAIVCHDFGIDPWEVIEAASTKPYGFVPFFPGPGTGGECVPVDPQYLAWRVRGKSGHQFRLVETATDVNERMPAHVSQRTAEILNETGKAVRGARILLLGVAYKGGSGDVRTSPALRVAERLSRSGATLTYHDPYVPAVNFGGDVYRSVDLTDEVLGACDLVLVLADHPDVDYARVVGTAPCVFDTKGVTWGIEADGRSVYRA